jgi:ABC-type transport system involved in cytochrome bd biosynthesis fused ATPase/permease subunit
MRDHSLLTPWQAALAAPIWAVILYGWLDAGWAAAIVLALIITLFAMPRHAR